MAAVYSARRLPSIRGKDPDNSFESWTDFVLLHGVVRPSNGCLGATKLHGATPAGNRPVCVSTPSMVPCRKSTSSQAETMLGKGMVDTGQGISRTHDMPSTILPRTSRSSNSCMNASSRQVSSYP
ncbi:hypothetical protein CLAIMM_05060, partial [Cladophialophora immunda]